MQIEHHVLHRHGLKWHVVTAGPPDGPPLLLLHCWSGNWTEWRSTLERLSGTYRCIAPDQLGFGQSDKPRGDHYRIPAQAERARFILDHFGHERAHILGHSMGGQIALTLAAEHPSLAGCVVVVDPPVTGRISPLSYPLIIYPILVRYGIEFPFRWTMRLYDLFPSAVIRTMYIFFSRPSRHREAALYWARQMGADGQLNSSAWAFKAVEDWDVRPLLKNISAPTLAIWGIKDRLVPERECDMLEQGIADCRSLRLPDTGHFPMIESFDAYIRGIEKFLGDR